ncbi:MAG: CBS domain-containing protein [Cyanophyceae cyanobacterium]
MKAADIMSKKVITIRSFATVAEAVNLMRNNGLRSLIVNRLNENDSYGIVTETDIIYKVAAFGKDPHQVRVCDIMTKPCIVVNPDLNIESVARLFANTGIRRAPIIQGTLLGVISVTDILLRSNFVEQPSAPILESRIKQEIAEARKICAQKGIDSPECAAAWDIVEELQAEAAHRKAENLDKTGFEEYCQVNPEAETIERYDPWTWEAD